MLRNIVLFVSLLCSVFHCKTVWASPTFAITPASVVVDPNGGTVVVSIEDTSLPHGMLSPYGAVRVNQMNDTAGYVDHIDFQYTHQCFLYFKPQDTTSAINGVVSLSCVVSDTFANNNVSCMLTLSYRYAPIGGIYGGIIQASDKYYEAGTYPDCIISIAPAVADGEISYVWEKKENSGSWTVLPNKTDEFCNPDKIGYQNVEYRRKAICGDLSAYSNTVEIQAALNAGIIRLEYNEEDAYINLVNERTPSVPIANLSWEKSEDLTAWTQFSGAQLSVQIAKPQVTTYYRRKASSSDGDDVRYSNFVCYSLTDPVYISTRTARDSVGSAYVESRTYYDGLGRPLQGVDIGAAMADADLVQPILYNLKGLEEKSCLPFAAADNGGAYVRNTEYRSDNYYMSKYNTTESCYPYVFSEYDESPLNRVVKTFQPGSEYQKNKDHYVVYDYGTNVDSDQIFNLSVDNSNRLVVNGYCGKNTLSKSRITNEDGHISEEFADSDGNTLLTRRYLGDTARIDTYYVYDIIGRLRWVVSPEGSRRLQSDGIYGLTDSLAFHYCYRYVYDAKGRLGAKYIPGRSNKESYFYDQYDRIIRTITSDMQDHGLSLNHVYDSLGRLVRSYTFQLRVGGLMNRNTHVSYYDSYNTSTLEFGTHSFVPVDSIVSLSDCSVKLRGLMTHEQIYPIYDPESSEEIGTSPAVNRTFYYDPRGRVVQTIETRSDGGLLRTSNKYDYAGNLLARAEQHQVGDETADIRYFYSYDAHGRVIDERIWVDGSEISSVSNDYDDMGRIRCVTFDSLSTQYSYNIQGWLTKKRTAELMNVSIVPIDRAVILPGSGIFDPWVKFETQLRYYDAVSATPCYSGNISEITERLPNNLTTSKTYAYDALDRLVNSTSSTSNVNSPRVDYSYSEQGIVYDHNGNILSFERVKPLRESRAYVRSHNGNRLVSSSETVESQSGFPGSSTPSDPVLTTFSYDNSGNLVALRGEQNLDFRYNYLNLPEEIHRADTMAMSFKYFADGTKYSALDASGNGYMYVGAVRYAVRDGEAEVESLPFSAGRIVKTSNGYEPHYYLTDHLGSTRMIIGPDGETVNATFDYLAYGLEDSDSDSPTSTTEFRFSGKELLSNLSDLEIYDFGARLYLPRYGIWGGIDPLSEKYYALTPYAYCAGNPIKHVDLNGMKVSQALDKYINNLLVEAAEIEQRNNNRIQALQAKIDAGGLSEGAVRRTNKRIARIESDNKEIAAMRAEIDVLRESSQLYDIVELNRTSDIYHAVTGYVETTDAVTILLYSGSYSRNSAVAHELKHAYQFETSVFSFGGSTSDGFFSIGPVHGGGLYYDISDEEAAFRRGAVFGGPALPDSEIYEILNSKPSEQGKIDKDAVPRLQALKNIFRLNGITYK